MHVSWITHLTDNFTQSKDLVYVFCKFSNFSKVLSISGQNASLVGWFNYSNDFFLKMRQSWKKIFLKRPGIKRHSPPPQQQKYVSDDFIVTAVP